MAYLYDYLDNAEDDDYDDDSLTEYFSKLGVVDENLKSLFRTKLEQAKLQWEISIDDL